MPSSGLIVVDDGRKAIAELLKAQVLWMGIGNLVTTAPWTSTVTPPNFSTTGTKLERELARRKCDLVAYVVADPVGDIVTDTNESFTIVTDGTRTNLLLTRFLFLPPTASETDYQIGVFLNTVPNMSKSAMSMKVNNVASAGNPIVAGSNKFQADTYVGGTPADLMPVPAEQLKPGYGRRFVHGGVTYIVTKVDFSSSIIYITPNFAVNVADDTTFNVVAVPGVTAGDKQILPSEIYNPGDLFVARNIQPVVRAPGARTQFDLVISI